MASLREHHTKELMVRHGLTVPEGRVVHSVDQGLAAAADLGMPLVIKALIPAGTPAEAGAVQMASAAEEVAPALAAMLGRTWHGWTVASVLLERRVTVRKELFISFTFDELLQSPALLMSTGADGDGPSAYLAIDVLAGPELPEVARTWRRLGLSPRESHQAAGATMAGYEVFREYDAERLAINPLGLQRTGPPVVLGATMAVDDEALYRQEEVAAWTEYGGGRYGRPPTPLEQRL